MPAQHPDSEIHRFERPPVHETVLSVGFAPQNGFTAAHAGKFWQEIATDFPYVEELPAYDMPIERFGRSQRGALSVSFGTPPTRPRVLFRSEAGDVVCQAQYDWFAVNWRSGAPGAYQQTRYSSCRREFERRLDQFSDFVQAELGSQLAPTQCEVSYVNHIETCDVWSEFSEAHKVFRPLSNASVATETIQSETVDFHGSFAIVEQDGRPLGRLHVSLSPITTPEGPKLLLNLTARGAPTEDSLTGVLSFMDLGREAIVHAFHDLTTVEMHKVWGKQDVDKSV